MGHSTRSDREKNQICSRSPPISTKFGQMGCLGLSCQTPKFCADWTIPRFLGPSLLFDHISKTSFFFCWHHGKNFV